MDVKQTMLYLYKKAEEAKTMNTYTAFDRGIRDYIAEVNMICRTLTPTEEKEKE